MDRQKNLGCVWGVHVFIALICVCYVAGTLDRGNVILFCLSSIMAVLEINFVFGMRFFMGRRWVWFLGYVCWFSLLVIGLVSLVMMFSDVKDAIEMGMVLMLGLPMVLGVMAGAFIGVINWNHLQLGSAADSPHSSIQSIEGSEMKE